MRLIFGRSHLPLSPLIRFLTWSQWSHVAVELDDGRVVEAIGSGVRVTTLDACTKRMSKYVFVDLASPDDDTAEFAQAWLLDQVGKKYDWGALFGFLFKRNWQDDNKWFCSELSGFFVRIIGYRIANSAQISRVTPQMLYMIAGEQT